MELKELISKINKAVDELDLVSARKYIEENHEILNANRSLLKGNARELLLFITSRVESGQEQLTRSELATVSAVNKYATNFDIRSVKLAIKDKQQLLLKADFINHLNSDAKVLLEGMGAIQRN
ncbi:hypothetical protein [Bacillus sp. AK128]